MILDYMMCVFSPKIGVLSGQVALSHARTTASTQEATADFLRQVTAELFGGQAELTKLEQIASAHQLEARYDKLCGHGISWFLISQVCSKGQGLMPSELTWSKLWQPQICSFSWPRSLALRPKEFKRCAKLRADPNNFKRARIRFKCFHLHYRGLHFELRNLMKLEIIHSCWMLFVFLDDQVDLSPASRIISYLKTRELAPWAASKGQLHTLASQSRL